MGHAFHYGVHSSKVDISAEDAYRLSWLGHTSHLRIIEGVLPRHELYRELTVLHFLRHYGMFTIVDISNTEDVRRISQHMQPLADVLLVHQGPHPFVIDHASDDENDSDRADRIRSRLRSIEGRQREGEHIRGYFCDAFVPGIRRSDLVLQAIIKQAQSVVP